MSLPVFPSTIAGRISGPQCVPLYGIVAHASNFILIFAAVFRSGLLGKIKAVRSEEQKHFTTKNRKGKSL